MLVPHDTVKQLESQLQEQTNTVTVTQNELDQCRLDLNAVSKEMNDCQSQYQRLCQALLTLSTNLQEKSWAQWKSSHIDDPDPILVQLIDGIRAHVDRIVKHPLRRPPNGDACKSELIQTLRDQQQECLEMQSRLEQIERQCDKWKTRYETERRDHALGVCDKLKLFCLKLLC
jgi:FtsZ-binding cell division protein ZapB